MTVSLAASKSFRSRANSACFYEAWVGSVLSRAGLYTTHLPWGDFSPEAAVSQAEAFDLHISYPTGLIDLDVEVKSVNTTFTSPADYPYDSVIVCSQNSFLKKWPGKSRVGRDFIYVSRDTGSMVWLPKNSAVTLGHETFDPTRNELYKVARAKKSQLKDLQSFVDYVKDKAL